MVSVIVRRNNVDVTIQANSVAELYSKVAQHFHIDNEDTIRLIYRGSVLRRSDSMENRHVSNESIVLMAVGSERPSESGGEADTNTQSRQSMGSTGGSSMAANDTIQRVVAVDLRSSDDLRNLIGNIFGSMVPQPSVNSSGATGTPSTAANPSILATETFSAVLGAVQNAMRPGDPPGESRPVTGVPLANAPVQGAAVFPNAVPRQVSAPVPPLAGVYVHVHCNSEELDSLPARLSQLQARMPHTHVHSGVSTIPTSVTSRIHVIPSAASAPIPVPVAVPETTSQGESHQQSNEETYVHRLLRFLTSSTLGCRMFLGDWSLVFPQRGVILQELENNEPYSITQEILGELFRQLSSTELLEQHRDTSARAEGILRRWGEECERELQQLCRSSTDAQSWGIQLRDVAVRAGGGFVHFLSRWLGADATERVLLSMYPSAVQQIPMLDLIGRQFSSSTLRRWASEYETRLAREGDVVRISMNDLNEEEDSQESEALSLDDLANSLLGDDEESAGGYYTSDRTSMVVQTWEREIGRSSGLGDLISSNTENPPQQTPPPDSLFHIFSHPSAFANERAHIHICVHFGGGTLASLRFVAIAPDVAWLAAHAAALISL